jgi:hypothetical protein
VAQNAVRAVKQAAKTSSTKSTGPPNNNSKSTKAAPWRGVDGGCLLLTCDMLDLLMSTDMTLYHDYQDALFLDGADDDMRLRGSAARAEGPQAISRGHRHPCQRTSDSTSQS